MLIDLRSDTVTKPSAAMLQAMLQAEVGDDVFGEDPTVAKLEAKCAAMFGMESGLFCPSGTMANQIAVKAHTQPMDEIICDKLSHIYNHENGGWAFHSGVSVKLTDGDMGRMTPAQVEEMILPDFDWYPNTRLVCIENTVNKGGGSVYSLAEMKALSDFCRARGLGFHLDGARIFHALTALNISSNELTGLFDSISVCISKGLGAPVGSVLLGSKAFIKKCRKLRKAFGGGMRQSGILAAACIYALDNKIQRLQQDHDHASVIANCLKELPWVKKVLPAPTNIVIFEVEDADKACQLLEQRGIRASRFSATQLRMVTHLDFTEEMLEYFSKKIVDVAI